MHRIYISGKVTGFPDYRKKFDEAEERLRCVTCGNPDFHVVNPMKLVETIGFSDDRAGWCEAWDILYPAMALCDCIYMLDNWKDSEGAKLELKYALENGFKVFYENKEDD